MTSRTELQRAVDQEYEAQLAKYIDMIEECASAIAAEARSVHYAAEYDDLRQEGMIALWTAPGSACSDDSTLEAYVIAWMYDYVSFLGKQRGAARGPSSDNELLCS